jgi:transcriptional regulator with PAS, ATPase and Fis domain
MQEKEFIPLGATATVTVMCICSHQRRPPSAVERKSSQDLYQKAQRHHDKLPPLRDRPEDVASAAHFLEKYNAENGKAVEGFTAGRWSGCSPTVGRIRELGTV